MNIDLTKLSTTDEKSASVTGDCLGVNRTYQPPEAKAGFGLCRLVTVSVTVGIFT